MTVREQFAIAALIIGILLLLAWCTYPAESAQPERYEVYVVQPEDTLWGIARDKYPNEHIGEMVYRIRALNGKDGKLLEPVLFVGQRIRLPRQQGGKSS